MGVENPLRNRSFRYLSWILLLPWIAAPPSAPAGSIFDDNDPVPATSAGHEPSASVKRPPAVPAAPSPTAPTLTPAAPTPPQPIPSAAPISIPAKADIEHSRQLLKAAYAEKLKDRSITARRVLADELLEEANKPEYGPADQFALVTGALDAAREGSDLGKCLNVAGRLSAMFQVDRLKVELNVISRMSLRVDDPGYQADNIHAGLDLVNALVRNEDLSDAFRVLAIIRPLSGSDENLRALVLRHTQDLEATQLAWQRIQPNLEKLKSNPLDLSANLAVGLCYCVRLGDWAKGLPLLVRGSDPNLRQLAREELSKSADPQAALKIADAWWDRAAARGTTEADAAAIKRHAASWYRIGQQGATGLQAKVVETRLTEVGVLALEQGEITVTGPRLVTNSIGMKLALLEPGTFKMGSPSNEANRQPNERQHVVTLTHPFFIGTTPVTQVQWAAVMGYNRSRFKGDETAYDGASWAQAVEFCEKLSQKENKPYRLPTEAEWEYACRAGSPTPYGDAKVPEEVGWYSTNSGWHTHPVAQKKPNAWGLYDMHGDIMQFCLDAYADFPDASVVDPTGPQADVSSLRVLRGGSWWEPPEDARSASRRGVKPGSGAV